MNSNTDLKSIWKQQVLISKPDVTTLIRNARKLKRKYRNQFLFKNVVCALTLAFIVYISLSNHFALITTRLGIIFIITGIVLYILAANGLLKDLYRSDPETDVQTYLSELLTIRRKQKFLQRTIMRLYFVLLTTGFICYIIEFLLRMTVFQAILAVFTTFGWIAFNWFYQLPRNIKKQQAEFDSLIEKLEAVNNNLMEQTSEQKTIEG